LKVVTGNGTLRSPYKRYSWESAKYKRIRQLLTSFTSSIHQLHAQSLSMPVQPSSRFGSMETIPTSKNPKRSTSLQRISGTLASKSKKKGTQSFTSLFPPSPQRSTHHITPSARLTLPSRLFPIAVIPEKQRKSQSSFS
jgi:hypothetical protein